jgi:DNA-binding MarR family transcriptional regulator
VLAWTTSGRYSLEGILYILLEYPIMAGADPSFTKTHLVRTLFILHSGTVGRKRLVGLLGVGEGSVRTIIKRLSSEGLIESSKLGHSLTEKGREVVEDKLKLMAKPVDFECADIVTEGLCSLVIVKGASKRVSGAVGLRDTALRAGADGAVILVYNQGLVFPGSVMELRNYPKAEEKLGELALDDGDVVVIGFGGTQVKAEDGAVAVALQLL